MNNKIKIEELSDKNYQLWLIIWLLLILVISFVIIFVMNGNDNSKICVHKDFTGYYIPLDNSGIGVVTFNLKDPNQNYIYSEVTKWFDEYADRHSNREGVKRNDIHRY